MLQVATDDMCQTRQNSTSVNLLVTVSHQLKISSEFSCVFQNRPHEYGVTSQTSDNMFAEKGWSEQ